MSRGVPEVLAKHREQLRLVGNAMLSAQSTARVRGVEPPREMLVEFERTRYRLTVCSGEAHSNAFIDNCGQCAPFWGVRVERLP